VPKIGVSEASDKGGRAKRIGDAVFHGN
jgi:hypothetical protein